MIISPNELNSQNLDEFEELLRIYKGHKVERFIEIGSLYGWSLQHFIYYAQPGCTALSIDLPVRQFVGPDDWRVQKQEELQKTEWPQWAKANKCKLYSIPASSSDPRTLELAKSIFKDDPIDFLFIDGGHTYQQVKKDFEMYSPLVRDGGIIALHDIGEKEEGDVSSFWSELKLSHKTKEILKDPNKEKGIGVVYV
jgi:cephalosporin hydroxylase